MSDARFRQHPRPVRRSLSAGLAMALFAAGLAAVFLIPYHVPFSPVFGESYHFGYNNRVGTVLALLVFAAVAMAGVLGLIGLPRATEEGRNRGGLQPSRRSLAVVLVATVLLTLAIYLLTARAQGFSESVYFIDRLNLLAEGRRPYRDFEFVYGSLQLYLPWGLAMLLRLNLTDAYYLFWSGSALLGVVLLWKTVRLIDLPARGKRGAFPLMATLLLVPLLSTGVNYNLLRYCAPLFCLLWIHRLDGRDSARTVARVVGSAVGLGGLLLWLSPEEGLSFAVAVVVALPARRAIERRPSGFFGLCLLTGMSGLLLLAAHFDLFLSMRRFSSGGFNLPILPGPHLLIFFAAMAVCLLYVTEPAARGRLASGAALVIVYSLGVLPAALGRCDWIHVMGYEAGVILCVLLILAQWRTVGRVATVAILVPFAVSLFEAWRGLETAVLEVQLRHVCRSDAPASRRRSAVCGLMERRLTADAGPEATAGMIRHAEAVGRVPSFEPGALFPEASRVVAAPFSYAPAGFGVYHSRAIKQGYFEDVVNLLTPEAVEQKIEELRAHPERDLLLPAGFREVCRSEGGSAWEMKHLFLLPIAPPVRHHTQFYQPICSYIEARYRRLDAPTAETAGYGLWRSVLSGTGGRRMGP